MHYCLRSIECSSKPYRAGTEHYASLLYGVKCHVNLAYHDASRYPPYPVRPPCWLGVGWERAYARIVVDRMRGPGRSTVVPARINGRLLIAGSSATSSRPSTGTD